jgi:hypothetical protein
VPAPPGYSSSDVLLTGVVSFGAGMLVGSLINDGHNDVSIKAEIPDPRFQKPSEVNARKDESVPSQMPITSAFEA